jgi:DNA (cytosine-5)-methyltransferase 1
MGRKAPRAQDSGSQEERAEAWPRDARERGDFLHPPRLFPEGIRDWRESLVAEVERDGGSFPGVVKGATKEQLRSLVDEGIAKLRELDRTLALLHGTPTLGNKKDAVDELVYIILSRKTREDAYQASYDRIKKAYPRWDLVLDAPRRKVESLVSNGGLGRKKTESILGALSALKERFGSCTLAPAARWPDSEVEDFLCSLPEVSQKSAYCVMMYALGRQVLPVDTHVGRILQRVGVFDELGLDLTGLDHKQLQARLASLVPPNLRHSLHVNLVVHGRTVCKAIGPECGRCELRRLCAHHRNDVATRLEQSDAPTVIDLFSGAGGLSEGFVRAGFRLVSALDRDPVALKTLWLNHTGLRRQNVRAGDVQDARPEDFRRMLGRRRLDVLIGAPPCQGFSRAGFRSKAAKTGYRLEKDARNYLFEYLVDLALALRPRLFLMENVPGMGTARKEDLSFLESAGRMLERQGKFKTSIWKLNASAYGVPQDRMRCFLVASLEDRLPIAPPEEYQDIRRQNFDIDALPPVTLEEALVGMPPRNAGTGQAVEPWQRPPGAADERRRRRYLNKFKLLDESPLIYNHFARYNNERDLELYALLRPGEDSVHAVERHGRADLMRYRTDVFDDKYARLRGDRPCKTIVAHLAKDGNGYIHPSEVRSLTIREAARVQSFHDGYVFCGSPSDQWVQIGNAVPPVMSEAIAKSFRRVLGGK